MIRIAFVIPTVDRIGGAERQVILLAKELARREHRVTIVALSGSGEAVLEELGEVGVTYTSLGIGRGWMDLGGWRRYRDWCLQYRPDLVHAHLPHASWFTRWARLRSPVRVHVDTVHTSATGGGGRERGYRISDWLTNWVTCVSLAVAKPLVAARMAKHDHVTVVPNGVPLPKVGNVLRGAPVATAPFRWVSVGRLSDVKDYPTLLLAFAGVTGEPRLTIVGSGPEGATLRTLAGQLGIEGRVEFAGFQAEVQPWLAKADAFVLTSRWEGLPMSVLEAGAAGLPVMATDAAGTREAMQVGETGRVVPVGDVPALRAAMSEMMAMPYEQRKAMGASGRKLVEREFSLEAVADRWERLYQELLAAHPLAARWRI